MIPKRSHLPKIAEMSNVSYTELVKMILDSTLARTERSAGQSAERKDSVANTKTSGGVMAEIGSKQTMHL